jgi:hypothetical protein
MEACRCRQLYAPTIDCNKKKKNRCSNNVLTWLRSHLRVNCVCGRSVGVITLGGAPTPIRDCLGISGMKGNEGHWGGEISIISQNFPKSLSILFHPLESSVSQKALREMVAMTVGRCVWLGARDHDLFGGPPRVCNGLS